MPPKRTMRYRVVKQGSTAFRRLRYRPAFQWALQHTKWFYLLFLVVIPLGYSASALIERTQTNYYLFTGPQGGTHYLLGPRFADTLNWPDKLERLVHLNVVPDFVPTESCGSLDNIFYMNHGIAHLSLVEDGLPLRVEAGPRCPLPTALKLPRKRTQADEVRLRALMPLYKAPLHIVARKTLGFSDVRDIKAPTRVYLGPERSATEFVASLVLAHYGMALDRQGKELGAEEAIDQMLAGKIDVGFFLIGLNAEAMQKLARSDQFHFLTVENAPMLELLYPYLDQLKIPAATYPHLHKDIPTVGTTTILAASTELSDVEVYEIASKLSHQIHNILHDIPFNAAKASGSTPERDLYYPLHEGALRFYNHDPPFFLDPHTLTGIGTYLTLVYALFTVSRQFVRNYLTHRLVHAVNRAVRAYRITTAQPETKRYQAHVRKVKYLALALLRDQRLTLNEYKRIDEYIKGYG
ncbi:MAG: TAXI family TRAP transporter solute-binding subunit [Nitrospira sp.]|nr:TAXI family TRAP transporter solute-binding subunit [Nitrospira sp.]